MGIVTTWVAYGRPAARALHAAVAAAKRGDPLAPVTVVVPSNHVGVAIRRLLASGELGPVTERGRGLAGVTFLTAYRLAELLGAAALAAGGRRPVSTPVVAAAVRAALRDDPGIFAPVADHPATEEALVAAHRELRACAEPALDALARQGARAADVVRLHRAARSRLATQWYDEGDLMEAATAAAAAPDPGPAAALGAVIAYLPQRLSPHAAALLRAVAGQLGLEVIAGRCGAGRADDEVAASVELLGGAPAPAATEPQALPVDAHRTTVVTTSDADEEVRAAVRAVVDAARAGIPLDRVAILHAGRDPYARLLHEQLTAAGIPVNGSAVEPVAARMPARLLLDLLALPDGAFRRHDVMAWLAAAPVLHEGRWAPVVAWERLAREAAVVAGRAQWDRRLAALADQLDHDARAFAGDPGEPAWRADRAREQAARARSLRAWVLGLVDALAAAAAAPRTWSAHAAWAAREVARHLGGAGARAGWPIVEQRAAERVELALDRLAALDAVEGPVELAVFTRTLALELDDDLGRVGRFGEGVFVGSVGMGTGLDLDLVVVLGLAEGSFPAAVRDDSLLPDLERAATRGDLPLRGDSVHRQHRELFAALAAAERHHLSLPRGDLRRSIERVPSRWILEVAATLGCGSDGAEGDLYERREPWLRQVPSFDAGLRQLAEPATEQEHRLRSLLARRPSPAGLAVAATPAADVTLARAAEVVTSRRSDRFTRFDGNLGGLAIPSPTDRPASPTQLERWAACPFAYLLRDLLGVDAVDDPDEQLRIAPIDLGNLVHTALERFVLEVLARPPEHQPAPPQAWTAADHARMRSIGEELCDEYEARGLTGRRVFWRHDRERILADLDRFLHADSAHRRTRRTRPVAAELAFGTRHSEAEAVPLELPGGRVVRFSGKADRLDVDDEGGLHVVDYKTGRPDGYRSLSEDDPDERGTRLQLAVYGAAARAHWPAPGSPVLAEYWFTSSRGGFTRVGYVVSDDVLARVAATIATIVGGIESGAFPPHPVDTSTAPWSCRACDPDRLGVTELRRQWERKRHDPALAPYAQLAEPLDEPDLLDAEAAAGG